ncbi:MAG: Glucose--fructose oxidoreductase precursor [Candidatus Hinthialibacteria bacterium OLB16]|nr:MAG: Glucose--fructose oxidoreductase precursor [Candidatus Hinthialibacteria bacterium OLB16]
MLKQEEIIVGRRNFERAAMLYPKWTEREFPASQAKPLEAAIIGTGNQGRVLLENANPGHITFKACCDLRPDHRALGTGVIKSRYNPDVRVYSDVDKMLSDGGFEAVLIATPLHTHAPLTLKCLSAGKHVLCEKTMAYTVGECDEMIQAAEKNGLVLAIGHQRHANPLYLQAQGWIDEGLLGDIYHIRSLWHRNNEWRNIPEWENDYLKEVWGSTLLSWARKKMPDAKPEDFKKMSTVEKINLHFEYLHEQDPEFDCTRYGYETPDQMANWRLYHKFSHGLMSELGSHQIDACNWLWKSAPESVVGAGGIFHYKNDGRDVFDHVFTTFRYPGDRTLVFSSITTNDFDNYYDQVMGTLGTIYLTGESDGLLFKEGEPRTAEVAIATDKKSKKPVLVTGESNLKLGSAAPLMDGTERFKAYGIEINMFAEACRTGNPALVGCSGQDGRKAAIAVFAANETIRTNTVQPCNLPEVIAAAH